MHCTNITKACPCGSTSFDLATIVMLTLDVSADPKDATADFDGFHKDPNDIVLTCRDCGENAVVSDARHRATVIALIRQEKRLGARLPDFSSYTFEDGTVIVPDEIEQSPLRDVNAGTAYQEAVKHREKYRAWKDEQTRRIEVGEIDVPDLHVMQIPWEQAAVKHLAALLHELAPPDRRHPGERLMTQQTTTAVNRHGWLIDLTREELESLLGTTLNVSSGARSNTGLVIKVAEKAIHLYRPDGGVPLIYAISSTRFNHVPGKPRRPALARCLAHELEWDQKAEANGWDNDLTPTDGYDRARGGYEQNLVGFYPDLLKEAAKELFSTAAVVPGDSE